MGRGYSNPVMDGIQAFGAIDSVFRGRRMEERAAAREAREQAWQDEQRQYMREERTRINDVRRAHADLYRLEQELQGVIGPAAAEYVYPEKRATDRKLTGEAMGRLQAGKLDPKFFLDYANTVYESQIDRGTGGQGKRIFKIGPSPDGKGIVAGLEIPGEDGQARRAMMTRNRGTAEEGDNEVKVVPVAALVRDNIQRQIIIDTFDRYGVGSGGSEEEQKARLGQAITEVKAKLLELGDTSIAQRDQQIAAKGMERQQAIEDDDRKWRRDVSLERYKQGQMNYRESLKRAEQGGRGDANFLRDAKNRFSTKETVTDEYGNQRVIEKTDWDLVNDINDFRMSSPSLRKFRFDEIEPIYRSQKAAVEAKIEAIAQRITASIASDDPEQALKSLEKIPRNDIKAVLARIPKEAAEALEKAKRGKESGGKAKGDQKKAGGKQPAATGGLPEPPPNNEKKWNVVQRGSTLYLPGPNGLQEMTPEQLDAWKQTPEGAAYFASPSLPIPERDMAGDRQKRMEQSFLRKPSY